MRRRLSSLVACFCNSVVGTPPLAAAFSESATATVTLETLDRIDIDIQQTLLDSDSTIGQSAGDTIEIAVNITNTGTTTLSTVAVSSSLLDDQLGRFVARYGRDSECL